MKIKSLFVLAAAVVGATSPQFAKASDILGPTSPVWSGIYVGVFGGVTGVESDYSADTTGAANRPLTMNEFRAANALTAAFTGENAFKGGGSTAGLVVGYDWQRGPWVIGALADISTGVDTQFFSDIYGTQARYKIGVNYVGTLQGKIGYALSPALLYVHGGYAYGETELDLQFSSNSAATESFIADGYVIGAGAEIPISNRLSFSADYSFTHLSQSPISGRYEDYQVTIDESVKLQQFRVGLNFRPFGNLENVASGGSGSWSPSWSGLYAGAFVGAGASSIDYDEQISTSLGSGNAGSLSSEDLKILSAISTLFGGSAASSGNLTETGAVFGAQIGYDQQHGQMVFGAFADLQSVGLKSDIGTFGSPQLVRYDAGLEYAGTVQGRVGVAVNQALLYVHGGYAFGQTNIFLEDEGRPPVDRNNMKHGYAIGAGAEFALSERISLVADYSYIDLGKDRIVEGNFDDSFGRVDEEAKLQSVRLGLNLRFGN